MTNRSKRAAIQAKTPEGSAEFRSDSNGRARLHVQVENVNLAAGRALTVSLHQGVKIAAWAR